MKTAYRLHCANISEVDQVYIGVIEFKTFDAFEMIEHISLYDGKKTEGCKTL